MTAVLEKFDKERRVGHLAAGKASLLRGAERFGLPVLFLAMVLVFSIAKPNTFATSLNWSTIATSQSVAAVAALALIFPLVAGRFDISVGSIVGITSIATAAAMSRYHLGLVGAVVVALVIGTLIGVVNGTLVSYLGVNSLITTLGMSTVLDGLVQAYTHGVPISSGLSSTLTGLSVHKVVGIPVLFVIMIVVAAIVAIVLRSSMYGRRLRAVGSNEAAAVLTGLRVRRVVLTSFVLSGVLAGLAGVLEVASQGSATPQISGIAFLLPALAAVFLGATTLSPGEYNVPGTVLALFFVGTAISGFTLLGVASWVTDVFDGAAVVIAVSLSAMFRRRRTGSASLGQ